MVPNNFKNASNELRGVLSQSVAQTLSTVPSMLDRQQQVARQFGYAKGNKYLVLLFPNANVQGKTGWRSVEDMARLATTCKSVMLNEQSWFTSEQADIHAGATRIFPYKRNSNNSTGVRLQFNCGADMFEKEFFQYWMRYIQNPITKRWKFYDDYANGSEMIMILLPNHVANFNQAVNELFSSKTYSTLTGYRFTEVYPYSLNINGGSLNYQQVQEPLFVDVGLMYHDVVPLTEVRKKPADDIDPVTETGFPYINSKNTEEIVASSLEGLDRAVDGFVVGARNAVGGFVNNVRERGELSSQQRSVLESYAIQLGQEQNIPRAMDGVLKQPSPGNGALDLGLTVLSQVQGFFGAGFYGNGWYPP